MIYVFGKIGGHCRHLPLKNTHWKPGKCSMHDGYNLCGCTWIFDSLTFANNNNNNNKNLCAAHVIWKVKDKQNKVVVSTNPFETYARQIESFLQLTVKIKHS